MKARFFALAALVLGLASCQNDFDDANVGVGGEVDFQLAVSAPELGATRADKDGQNGYDSAFGAIDYLSEADWANVDLRYTLEVYDYNPVNKTIGTAPVKDRMVKVLDKYEPVVFDLRLVPNRHYHFVVFADFVAENATDTPTVEAQAEIGKHHIIGATLADITLKNDAINTELTDAYFATAQFEITNSAAKDMILRRPYGKVRVVATDLHELNLNVEATSVKVEYTAPNANKFNAVDGTISGEGATTFTAIYNVADDVYSEYTEGYDKQTTTALNGTVRKSHMTLSTDYILATDSQEPIQFRIEVFDQNSQPIKETVFSTDIPVQRNYLTTVIGNILTTGTEINVSIDDNFFRPEEVIEAITVKTQEEFEAALATAANQEYAVIELTNDIEWATGAGIGSTPLIDANAITENLVIYGNGSKLIAKGSGVGSIRMANGGTLTLNDVVVVDESVSYAENSWEYGYLEFAGNIVFNNCVFENAIMVQSEDNEVVSNAQFNGCAFNSNDANQYDVWVADGKAFFNDCDIEGYRGIKMHEAYGSEVVEVVIDGCRFTNLSKKPGVAMGTLNAETKVVIKNSTFTNCQAGDQGLYIYETDTDVTTFNFILENNTVAFTADTNEAIAEALAKGGDMVVVAAGEYTFPSTSVKAGQTIVCEEDTVFTGKSNLNINGATVIGATFESGSDNLVAYYSTINGTYKNCVFNGDLKFSEAGDIVVFENCVFNGPDYALHFDTAVANSHVILKGCEVNSDWRVAIGAAVSMFEAIDTKFNVDGFINLWGKAKFTNCAFNKPYYWICCMDTTEFTNCTCEGRDLVADDIRIEDTVININDELFTSSNEGLKVALANNASVVNLLAGNYELSGLNFVANNVTLKGVDKANVVLNLEKSIYLQNKSLTLENLTYNLNAGKGYTEQAFAFVHHATAFNLKNCNVNRLRLNVHEANIEGCTFTLNTSSGFDGYCIYYYGNDNSTVNVKNSTFATAGKGICIYSEHAKAYNLNVDECSFTSSNSATDKAAIQMHTELGIYGNVKITDTTATGFADINGGLWNELNNSTGVETDKFDIWVDGTQVH